MLISKSTGTTPTEIFLARLCDQTFLGLWSYPNPFKDDGKELCDLLAVFEDRAFLFFDRHCRQLRGSGEDLLVAWNRWKKNTIDKQVNTAKGAERYLRSGRQVYLDATNKSSFPIEITQATKIHKFVVAHGADQACKRFSRYNSYGSLAVCYGGVELSAPFVVSLERDDKIH